jgi:glutamate-1-semialdehyde 2,1-aminomutase
VREAIRLSCCALLAPGRGPPSTGPATGFHKIVKFEGCYHGHGDMFLVQAGSGVATLGLPDGPGVPPGAAQDTLTAPFNGLSAVEVLFQQFPDEIAAVILEPVAGNMGVTPPVMTGFRVALGGAQELYGIDPDLTTLGKVIGGGLPVGAYAGKREIMETVAPAGPMYQAGTLSGNPLAMTAGLVLVTLRQLRKPGVFERIVAQTERLCQGIGQAATEAGVPILQTQVGTMFCTYFAREPVTDYASAKASDTAAFGRFFQAMLDAGVYLAPSQFEAGFTSTAHSDRVIGATVEAAKGAFGLV